MTTVSEIRCLMGGSIGVTSTIAVGSTFWFEIPFELEAETGSNAGVPHSPDFAEPGSQSLQGVRALVVDDSDILQEIVRRILEDQGARVTCCSDGASALQHVHAHREPAPHQGPPLV